MTTEELLNPRYKVIAPYPNSKYRMGEIINYTDQSGSVTSDTFCQFYDKYPHLFKKPEWWEERDEKDLPEYIWIEGKVIKVKKWIIGQKSVWLNVQYPEPSFTMGSKFYPTVSPATLEEYEQYLQSKK